MKFTFDYTLFKKLREGKGLTIKGAVRASENGGTQKGLSPALVRRVEKGKNFTIKTLLIYCKVLDLNPATLFRLED